MQSVQDEVNQELMVIQLEASKFSGWALNEILYELRDTDLHRRGGELTFKEINQLSDNLKYIELPYTREDMELFNAISKQFQVRYAVKEDPEANDKALIFFEGRNQQVIEKCLETYIQVNERRYEALEQSVKQLENRLDTENIDLPPEIKNVLLNKNEYETLSQEDKEAFWNFMDKHQVRDVGILNKDFSGNQNRPLRHKIEMAKEKVKVRTQQKEFISRDRGER